jgi:hypothetical protein
LVAPSIRSFVKPWNTAAKSERGGVPTTNSLVEKGHMSGNKLNLYGRDVRQSDLNKSTSHEDSYCRTEYQAVPAVLPMADPYMEQYAADSYNVKTELSREISELKKFKDESTKFYDSKISEIRNLSSKLNKYRPMDQINQITNKLTLSNNTTQLIRKALTKKSQ